MCDGLFKRETCFELVEGQIRISPLKNKNKKIDKNLKKQRNKEVLWSFSIIYKICYIFYLI